MKEKAKNLPDVQDNIRYSNPPVYIELSKGDVTAKLIYVPNPAEIPVQCETSLVIEYYSR
jgi:ribosomal protein S4